MFKPIKSINQNYIMKSTDLNRNIKELINQSPFIYGAKKISFKVKRRKTFWENIENSRKIIKDQIIKSLLLNTTEKEKEDITLKAVSPVLALTLILLNKDIFKSKVISDYLGDISETSNEKYTPKVYAYNKYYYLDDEHFEGSEKYTQSLPAYYHIHAATITYGKYSGSTKKYYDSDGSNVDNLTVKMKDAVKYIWEQGYLKKVAFNEYGNKNSDLAYLRSGYGFGPVCISTFLNIVKYGKKMIPEIICGLLLSEDSGMVLKDAISVIDEFLNPGHRQSVLDLSYFKGLSTITILSILEEIGSYFLISLLSKCYKKNIQFNLPYMSILERNIYDVGYLIGDAMNDLRNIMVYIIEHRLFKQDSLEVFSITVPCVMTNNGTSTNSILETKTSEIIYDNLMNVENIFTKQLNISSCLNDIEEFNYLINPVSGYTVSDFINKNITNHFIEQMIDIYDNSKPSTINSSTIKEVISSDYGIAPRIETENAGEFTFDYTKCTPLYQNDYYNTSNNEILSPRLLVNRLFKDNNCTLEYQYRCIDQATDGEERASQLTHFYDIVGLAITRIILINSLCNQTITKGSDIWLKFFKVFSGYLKNYIDIDITSLT